MKSVHRFVTNDFTVRIAAVDSTSVVQEMQKLAGAKPLACLGVGRAMTGALLLAASLKEGQDVGLLFKGNGPLKSLYAEASFEGTVRGYCPFADYEAPQVSDTLSLAKAMGSGTLTVARHQPFQRQPFQGVVEMVSGEVGDDIAHYLHQSHQIRSVVSLGVFLNVYGQVEAAGGVIIEVMPGVEEEVVQKIQRNVDSKKISISKMLLEGAQPVDLVAPYLEGLPFTQLNHDHPIRYFCPCTKERVLDALAILGVDELQEMVNEDKNSEITCQVCGKNYSVGVDELSKLKESVRKSQMH